MRDILKMLNDRSAGDFRELTDDELRSFEAPARTGERTPKPNAPAAQLFPSRPASESRQRCRT
jgi:hypothetical protein